MVALLLDSLSLQLDRIPPGLRAETVRVAGWLPGNRGDMILGVITRRSPRSVDGRG